MSLPNRCFLDVFIEGIDDPDFDPSKPYNGNQWWIIANHMRAFGCSTTEAAASLRQLKPALFDLLAACMSLPKFDDVWRAADPQTSQDST